MATRFAAVTPIVSIDEIKELIYVIINNLREHYGKTPKIFVSDNAAKYISERLKQMMNQLGCQNVKKSLIKQSRME